MAQNRQIEVFYIAHEIDTSHCVSVPKNVESIYKRKICFSPDLSYISQTRMNVIIPIVHMNDSQAYGICNGEIDILSVMVIPTAKYDSANSNI